METCAPLPPPPPPPPKKASPLPSLSGKGGNGNDGDGDLTSLIANKSKKRAANGSAAAAVALDSTLIGGGGALTVYEDRSEHGCGLSNLGATCYLNSLLQTLFATAEFRSFVFRDRSEHKIVTELQRLFARMQAGAKPFYDTKALVGSFGWSESEAFEQQDAQELMRVLLDAMEQVSGTELTSQYRGTFCDSTRCQRCQRATARTDPFCDISLVVRGTSSVEEALAKFTEPEKLLCSEGNGVECTNCGGSKTDATKELRILELPRILTIQLKRFDYEAVTYRRVKLTHSVSFPETLDMSPFLEHSSLSSEGCRYDLFSVLLHSGSSAHGGHYLALVRNAETGKWVTANDSTITPVDPTKVAEELRRGFGGDPRNSTCAYMLVYRRHTDNPEVKTDVAPIPAAVLAEVEAENAKYVADREAYRRKRDTIALKVLCPGAPAVVSVSVHKADTLGDLIVAISKAIGSAVPSEGSAVDLRCVRVRLFNTTTNAPAGPAMTELGSTVSQLGLYSNATLYVETRLPCDGDFPSIEDVIKLTAVRLDGSTGNFSEPVPVAVASDSTLRTLRGAVAAAMKFAAERTRLVRVVVSAGVQEAEVLGADMDARRIKDDLGLEDGCVVYAEEEEVTQPPSAGPTRSALLERFEQETNNIDVCFNRPGSLEYSEHVVVDRRRGICDLISLIAGHPSGGWGDLKGGFRVLSCGINKKDLGAETGEEKPTLRQLGLFDGCSVCVVPGRAAGEENNRVELAIYRFSPTVAERGSTGNERFVKLADWSVERSSTIADLASRISGMGLLTAVQTPGECAVPPELLRFRAKVGPRAAQILLHTRTVDLCFPNRGAVVGSGNPVREIAVQLLERPDPVSPPSGAFLVVELQFFDPESGDLGKFTEVAVDSDATLRCVADTISSDAQPMKRPLYFAKPPRFLREPDQLKELNWYCSDEPLQLRQPPLSCKDGDLLLFASVHPESGMSGSGRRGGERSLRINV